MSLNMVAVWPLAIVAVSDRRVTDFVSKVKATPLDRPVLLKVRHGDQSRYVAIERGHPSN